ncbi:hypothetical protein HMPREF0762_01971 [Slackia exigua ATCC 700122]|uniref:Uncharacterized protein n=1 Tax=Slackia exigua (strain ATCC 700122 / DSM 15923 / CIP 105133 / JCM 11022 / KCTC 5966 / S-7) TaxID=649764 RepID=D0WJE4_SLAES|nr:hypothetical protein HMPREF0762_01971 [Slackia exigua ATCC 700122]
MEAESTAGESPRSTPSRLNAGFSGKVAAKKAGLELEPEPVSFLPVLFSPAYEKSPPEGGLSILQGQRSMRVSAC